MRITIIGVTGTVGSRLVAEAGGRGHAVTAVSRTPNPALRPERVEPVSVDVNAPEKLASVLTGTDAVILTIRQAPSSENTLARLTTTVLDHAARIGVRALVMGGAVPLHSPNHPPLLVGEDPAFVPTVWQRVARAGIEQLHACQPDEKADWTYLSPAAVLGPGERTGRYRRGTTTLLTAPDGTSRISVEDLAVAAIDELGQRGRSRHFTVVSDWHPALRPRPYPEPVLDDSLNPWMS